MSVGVRIPLKQAPPEPKRYTRDVFLYSEHGDAQCGTCVHWTGERTERCALLGKALKVDADDSCSLYAHGKPHDQAIIQAYAPEEVGFVDRKVRCENCRSFDANRNHCGAYERLNNEMGDWFDLDETVHAKGCCTAQKAKTSKLPPAREPVHGIGGTTIELRVGVSSRHGARPKESSPRIAHIDQL